MNDTWDLNLSTDYKPLLVPRWLFYTGGRLGTRTIVIAL